MAVLDMLTGDWRGTCGFRMPSDDLADRPSTAHAVRDGEALVIEYTWEHPDDGPQAGRLGLHDDGGRALSATWTDSWHQKDEATLSGDLSTDRAQMQMTYMEEWGWRVTLESLGDDEAQMTMHNVIPESHARDGIDAGPYVVMHARWARGGANDGSAAS